MYIKVIDYRVMQLAYKPTKELLDNFLSNQDDKQNNLPIASAVILDEDDISEFFIYFKIQKRVEENSEGLFHLDFLVRCKSESLKLSHNRDVDKLKAPALEVAFPFLVGWVNNFFVTSGYDNIYISKHNLV